MIYRTIQTYTALETTTCGDLCHAHRLDRDKDWSDTLFVMKEGDYPLRVSTHWPWLAKQQSSQPVTLLKANSTESFYDRSSTANPNVDT